jgi:crotonobetainyl-CoA:carnitine CoA-transferase CaiB-like acyl-CoA transferase
VTHGPKYVLDGIRVVELADEQAEYAGLLLASMGAEVVKVEPAGGNATRQIGPFFDGVADTERSLFFWHYNRGKKSVELDVHDGVGDVVTGLLDGADIFLTSETHERLAAMGLAPESLRDRFPRLIVARTSPFGDHGPWSHFRGSDLIHLALGGVMMSCGYDPRPDGSYDLPPIAPQMWHAYHIAGEHLLIGALAALIDRERTGAGQHVQVVIHEAVSKNTELDVMFWTMLRTPVFRQTCTHARPTVGAVPPILSTKDGRRFIVTLLSAAQDRPKVVALLQQFGVGTEITADGSSVNVRGRAIPGSAQGTEEEAQLVQALQRLLGRFTFEEAPWRAAQELGLMMAPVRRPEESARDEHWRVRGTFTEIHHPEHDRSFVYPTSKWISSETVWRTGARAPLLGEDTGARLPATKRRRVESTAAAPTRRPRSVLSGIRVLDFSWFLASAGGTRFLGALGAEVIKVEWSAHPDTRVAVNAPAGGRAARDTASAPLPPGNSDPDMGGQFNNKNAGKRGISLNVRDPQGLALAKRLVAISDVVAEGFSPGVMRRWGLGYDALKEIRPDIIYAQQSGMGEAGTYGRFRAVGPVAQSFAGLTEMSGFPDPALPAGWGYSYLDWIAAYSFAGAVLAALFYRDVTGKGQWIDASQCEAGIFASGPAALAHSANGTPWARTGNESPWKPAAPHGVYRCTGDDRWLAIACFDDPQWWSLATAAGRPEWRTNPRFAALEDRLAHLAELDRAVESWTRGCEPYDAMQRLQAAGVPAGVCQTAEDRCERDPQLAELNWLTEVTGTKIGRWPVYEVPITMSETPLYAGGPVDRGAPIYGEDNEYVFGELLGLSARAIRKLVDDGVIEDSQPD